MCACVCKCNVCECYSAVLVVRLTYTSTKTCIKNEWHDYSEYIYPLSISKLCEGYALSKCFSLFFGFVFEMSFLFILLYCLYYLTCIMSLDCTAYELALYEGCCVVISLPGGVEPFTARVEKVRYIKCPYP